RVTTTAVTSTARVGGLRCVPGSDDTTLELAPLPLRESTPDAETFVVREGVLEALSAHLAALADPLRLAGRAALLGEEGLGVGLCAQRTILPAEHGVVVGRAEDRQDVAERGRRGLGLRRERTVRVEQIPHHRASVLASPWNIIGGITRVSLVKVKWSCAIPDPPRG